LTRIPPVNRARDRDDDWTSATIAGPEVALKYLAALADSWQRSATRPGDSNLTRAAEAPKWARSRAWYELNSIERDPRPDTSGRPESHHESARLLCCSHEGVDFAERQIGTGLGLTL